MVQGMFLLREGRDLAIYQHKCNMTVLLTRLSCEVVVAGCGQGPTCASGASPLLSLAVRALRESGICIPLLVLAVLYLALVGQQLIHLQ
jgi:hypothetical protein